MMNALLSVAILAISFTTIGAFAQDWAPAEGPLKTRWTDQVSPEEALPAYPRPQMTRPRWKNLNGPWDYAVRPRDEDQPDEFDGRILVPYPIESSLSGVMRRVSPDEALWYRRTFSIPGDWVERVLLHFGAVDWETTVWVNGREVGEHRGGYDAFVFDITDALKSSENEVIVRVHDPTDAGKQPRGKQVREPHGIWYTPTTGIWQTVWLEPVAAARVDGLRLTPNLDDSTLLIEWDTELLPDHEVKVIVTAEGSLIANQIGKDGSLEIRIPDARHWSPEDPFLYELRLTALDPMTDQVIDMVESYFGMRAVTVEPDDDGVTRIHLNGEPYFMFGPLDQGFWPDGLYTAPTDEALRYDVEITKRLGYNTARKHVKVEPARWYYWCDKLGLLVWQDMPSGDDFSRPGGAQIVRDAESAHQFELELERMIDTHYNSPSIVIWVIFNEGWGQYDTKRLTEWAQNYDPTRLISNASGWNDLGVGDVHDLHSYPGPASPEPESDRAAVLGEFGGLGLPLSGHTWQDESNWGYRSFENREALNDAYVDLIDKLRWLRGSPGLSAAIYTQTSDVEIEVNGVMTYDREVVKLDETRVKEAHRRLFLPPPSIETVVETSQVKGHEWRYTTTKPAEDWMKSEFKDRSWNTGEAGFGREGTPGAVVRTPWMTPDIWLRRTITPPADVRLTNPYLMIHHDEDAEVYLNGVLAASPSGYTTSYVPISIAATAGAAIKAGEPITMAVHCHQTGGGQYIDVGIVDVIDDEETKR